MLLCDGGKIISTCLCRQKISDIEMHDGYEPISIGDGKIIYTNTEPVQADGLLFEDGTSEFNEFGTVIENEKSK